VPPCNQGVMFFAVRRYRSGNAILALSEDEFVSTLVKVGNFKRRKVKDESWAG